MKQIKKIYGPYMAKRGSTRGRKVVIVSYIDGLERRMLYSRFVMEQSVGRELKSDEHVDHKDQDKTNDALSNLQILPKRKHEQLDAKRVRKVLITCVWCGVEALKTARYLDHNAKQGKAGPFCGRRCSGQYGAAVQNEKFESLPAQPGDCKRDYYTQKEHAK